MKQLTRLIVLLLLPACAGTKNTLTTHCSYKEQLLEVVTYNVGLAPGIISLATPRTEPVARAISRFKSADLICLQEVWMPSARNKILKGLGLPDENVLYKDTGGEGVVPGKYTCTQKEISGIYQCSQKRCSNVTDEGSSICILNKCKAELFRMYLRSKKCLHCLVSQAGKSSSEAVTTCTSPDGAGYVYNGQNGLILASRWPLSNKEVITLPSSAAHRIALFATVKIPGHQSIEVGCAHLSSRTYIDPFDPEFDDWEDEMAAQATLISKRLKARAGSRPQIFIGDMNAGPSRSISDKLGFHVSSAKDIRASALKVWYRLVRMGWESPVTYVQPPFCTTCRDNSLRGSNAHNYVIDHVLFRDPKGGTDLVPVCARQLFHEKVTIKDYNGKLVESNLSDHDGVGVKFRLK